MHVLRAFVGSIYMQQNADKLAPLRVHRIGQLDRNLRK